MTLLRDLIHAAPVRPDRIGIIHIPESVNANSGYQLWRVLQTGPGRVTRKGVRIPCECSPGDRIVTVSHVSGPIELPDGSSLLTEDQVIAVIKPTTPKTK